MSEEKVSALIRKDGRAVMIVQGETRIVLTPAQARELHLDMDTVLDDLDVAPQLRTRNRLIQARIARHLAAAQHAADQL